MTGIPSTNDVAFVYNDMTVKIVERYDEYDGTFEDSAEVYRNGKQIYKIDLDSVKDAIDNIDSLTALAAYVKEVEMAKVQAIADSAGVTYAQALTIINASKDM